jgi:hypothetical protein
MNTASRFNLVPQNAIRNERATRQGSPGAHALPRSQLAFPSNVFLPLIQMLDLISRLAILTLGKEPDNLVSAAWRGVLTAHGRPINHSLSDAKLAR